MKNSKGLTLIEVIVSFALLGLLATIFIPGLTGYFTWLVNTKTNITQVAFKSQGIIELDINNIKEALSEGETLIDGANYKYNIVRKIEKVELFKNEFNDFNRQYPNVYEVEVPLKGNKLYRTWVGDERLPELPVPTIVAESLIIQRENVDTEDKYDYGNNTGLSLKGIANMTKNPQLSLNRYRSDWYISKPGFIMPVHSLDSIDRDYDMGRIYPSYPNDYIASPIHSELGNNFTYINEDKRVINIYLSNNKLKDHLGKHVLYAITPFSKALKKGNTSNSMPVYIYQPAYTESLILHLDASTIDKDDKYDPDTKPNGSIVFEERDERNYEKYNLRFWKNNRPNISSLNSNKGAKQQDTTLMPILIPSTIKGVHLTPEIPFQGDENNGRVWGRALGNKEDSTISRMTIENMSIGNQWSMFMIIRAVDAPLTAVEDVPIIQGLGNLPWSFTWFNDGGELKLGFESGENNVVKLPDPLNQNQWYMVRVTANNNEVNLKAVNLKSGISQVLKNNNHEDNSIGNLDNENINIIWNGIELSEVLIYSSNIGEMNIEKVETYLIEKFNPQ